MATQQTISLTAGQAAKLTALDAGVQATQQRFDDAAEVILLGAFTQADLVGAKIRFTGTELTVALADSGADVRR